MYTRPPSWRGLDVPDVLLSGHHANIARWRRDRALERTARRRPDLLARLDPLALDAADHAALDAVDAGRQTLGPSTEVVGLGRFARCLAAVAHLPVGVRLPSPCHGGGGRRRRSHLALAGPPCPA